MDKDTSLRSRRSTAPRKGPPRQSSNTGGGGTRLVKAGSGRTPRDPRKQSSRVDDKIKKRMSMRYNDVASPTDGNVPAMPGMPVGLMSQASMRGRPGREQDEVVKDREGARLRGNDNQLLDADEFDPDAFLKIKLQSSTEAELKSLQSSLRSAQADTASDLQRNVFKNYAEFVLISKEISTLENEMLELKESLSEYKSMPSLLHVPDSSNGANSSNAMSMYKRSSVADLRIMYFNQMQTLHSTIEGSAKFAPNTPGRHIVAEVEGILALNPATYKISGKVKFVVLDDAVLVAKRRRRAGGQEGGRGGGSISEGKLVAERCWPLNEMLVLDTKDSASMTNVFKIRHGKETYVYRTESAVEKKSLLGQLRIVAEELAEKKRKEREGEHERRKSTWQGLGSASSSDGAPPMPDWEEFVRDKTGSSEAKRKTERDIQWIGEWSDELSVAIALKEWEKATSLVEEGRQKLPTTPAIVTKLPLLSSSLVSSLLTALSLPTNRKATVVHLTSLLLRLNAGAAARNAFLEMRSKAMKSYVRKIRFEGHVGAYVGDLAIVCFSGIKHTADWFLASFKENEVSSALVDWANQEITNYAEQFRRQVYTSDSDEKTIDEAKRMTYAQSKKLLEDVGLDFRFLLDELLQENPKEPLKAVEPFTIDKRPSIAPPTLIIPPSGFGGSRGVSPGPGVSPAIGGRSTTPLAPGKSPSVSVSMATPISEDAPPGPFGNGYVNGNVNGSSSPSRQRERDDPRSSPVSSPPRTRPRPEVSNISTTAPPPAPLSSLRTRTPVSASPGQGSSLSSATLSSTRVPYTAGVASSLGPNSGSILSPAPRSGYSTNGAFPQAEGREGRISPSARSNDSRTPVRERERPPRNAPVRMSDAYGGYVNENGLSGSVSGLGSPVPGGPPPRSMHRPGSSISQRSDGGRPPPAAVPQRQGMF